jgi:hypothetical protein
VRSGIRYRSFISTSKSFYILCDYEGNVIEYLVKFRALLGGDDVGGGTPG